VTYATCSSGNGLLTVGVAGNCTTLQQCMDAIDNSSGDYCNLIDDNTIYAFNDSRIYKVSSPSGKGVIQINQFTSNMTVDCNGATINNTNGTIISFNMGVNMNGGDGHTIRNCTFYNGARGIEIDNNADNILIEDNIIHLDQSVGGSACIETRSPPHVNITIQRNIVTGSTNGAIRTHGGGSFNIQVLNNTIGLSELVAAPVYIGSDGIVTNNVFYNVGGAGQNTNIAIVGSNNYIANNDFNGELGNGFAITILDTSLNYSNNVIVNNTIINFNHSSGMGIYLIASPTTENIQIVDNYFYNNRYHIQATNGSSLLIKDNIFNLSSNSALNFIDDNSQNNVTNNLFVDSGTLIIQPLWYYATATVWNYSGNIYDNSGWVGAETSFWAHIFGGDVVQISGPTDDAWSICCGANTTMYEIVDGTYNFDLILVNNCTGAGINGGAVIYGRSDTIGLNNCAEANIAFGEACCDLYIKNFWQNNGFGNDYTMASIPSNLTIAAGYTQTPYLNYKSDVTKTYPTINVETNNNTCTNNIFRDSLYTIVGNEFDISGDDNEVYLNNFLVYSYADPISDAGSGNSFCEGTEGNFYEQHIVNRPIGDCGQGNITSAIATGSSGILGSSEQTVDWTAQSSSLPVNYNIYSGPTLVGTTTSTTFTWEDTWADTVSVVPWVRYTDVFTGTQYDESTLSSSLNSLPDQEYLNFRGGLLYILIAFGTFVIIIAATIILIFVTGGDFDLLTLAGTVMVMAVGTGILMALLSVIMQTIT